MPRKTKKHKKRADQRRAFVVQSPQKTSDNISTEVSKSQPKEEQPTKPLKKKEITPEDEYNAKLRKYTIRDSIRTIAIISLLFLAQIAVYYAYQQGYFENIL